MSKGEVGDESVYKARTDQEARPETRQAPNGAAAFETSSLREPQLEI